MEISKNPIKIPGVKSIIGVISGKGGVGKTFIAGSLAATLAKQGKKTALFDADINCPNVFKIFGINAKLTPAADNKLTPAEKYGIKMVSMAGMCSIEDEAVLWRGPLVSKILQQLMKETIWGDIDVMVIDFPTGTSDPVLAVLQNFSVDGLIVVTTPQNLAILDARRTLHLASMLRIPVFGVVENMRGEIFGDGGAGRLCDAFRIPLLASIPMRKQITALSDQGIPPVFQMEELEVLFAKITRGIFEKLPDLSTTNPI